MSVINIAVIGAGQFAHAHLEAYAANRRCRVIAVVDRNRERAIAAAESFGAEGSYTSVAEMLSEVAADAASLVTPPAAHRAAACELLEAGVPVLLEKPVALTSVDARAILDCATETGTLLIPAHLLRFSPAYGELKRRLDSDVIGQILSMSFLRHRSRDHQQRFPDVHPSFMTAIHDIDMAMWLTGSEAILNWADCLSAPGQPQPAVVWANATTTDGVSLRFDVSWALYEDQAVSDTVTVSGTDGELCLKTGSTGGPLIVEDSREQILGDAGDADQALGAEIDYFLSCVAGANPSRVVTMREAVDGVRLAEHIAAHGPRSIARSSEKLGPGDHGRSDHAH